MEACAPLPTPGRLPARYSTAPRLCQTVWRSNLNDAVRQDRAVRDGYVPLEDAQREYGLIRSRSVAPPPTTDGKIRTVEIAGLDRQACGGTHLGSTGRSPSIRVLEIGNKVRHNRRVYIGLQVRAPQLR